MTDTSISVDQQAVAALTRARFASLTADLVDEIARVTAYAHELEQTNAQQRQEIARLTGDSTKEGS